MHLKLEAVGYPGGSKSRVTKAGDAVRHDSATVDDLACIDTWRAAHWPVLNTFQSILRQRARNVKKAQRDRQIIVGQRYKRKSTIFNKLGRFPKMELARMDDIAGCRVIFPNIQTLHEFRAAIHAAKFHHVRRNLDDKYNYIKAPKKTGYRGIHDVYEYNVKSEAGIGSNGLFLELQYRTYVQHAWATAVEMIGIVTAHQPKFNQGDPRYLELMGYASEILARAHEGCKSCYPDVEDKEVVQRFLDLDSTLGIINLLRGLNASADEPASARKNFILMFHEGRPLEVLPFKSALESLRALFELERKHPERDIVLVRGDSDEVRTTFRNYYTDAKEFLSLLESGCDRLHGGQVH